MKPMLGIVHMCIVVSAWPNLLKMYTTSSGYCDKSSNQPHTRLKDDVLCDYDPYIRPKLEHRNATTIGTKLILKSFNYDMHSHSLTINVWTTLFWMDDHLKWNPEDYEGIEVTHFSTDTIWTPDLSHYNRYEQDGYHDIMSDVDCHVRHTGKVVCLTPGRYDSLCTADLRRFPYDKQICHFIVGSWVHTGEEINFEFLSEAINLEELTPNPEWNLVNVTFTKHISRDACCLNSTFPSLIYEFLLERKGGFIQATAIIPSLGLITMTLLVLFLDIRETERVTLIVCNIISHIIYLQYISWNVPSFGDNVPKIILFGRDSLLIVFCELTITVILRNLTNSPENRPNWTMNIVSKALESRIGHTVLVLDFTMKNVAKIKNEEDGENIIENVQPNIQKDCTLFAKLVDRLCVILFLLTYFVMIILFIL